MKRRFLTLMTVIALAAALGSGLFASARAEASGAQAPQAEASALAAGALLAVDLDAGEAVYNFVAPSGSVYDVWLFPAEDEPPQVTARLWRGERLVAEGEGGMPALSLRLAAETEYRLELTGSGRARLELARHALSRCFALPVMLKAEGDAYSKAFVREGDAHWYGLDADSTRPVSVLAAPTHQDMRLSALLFDGEGRLLAEGSHTAAGACLLDFIPESGRRYRIRLSCPQGETGLYDLTLTRLAGEALPEAVALSAHSLTVEGRDTAMLTAVLAPEGAGGALYWESSQPSVAWVDAQGRVTGRDVGTAQITVYASGGASDACAVEVRRVPVTGVALLSRQMTLSVGDDAAIECDVLPENASDTRLNYAAQPEGIVEIDSRGVLRGIREGEATVTVRSEDGDFADALTVRVNPAPRRWRALLVGEQNYAEGIAAVRTGSINSVSGMRSMLENLAFDGAKFQVGTLLDASRDEVLAGIANGFFEAVDGDLSLFYITCHGYYAGGMTFLQMYDGSVLAAAELAQAGGDRLLRQRRGHRARQRHCGHPQGHRRGVRGDGWPCGDGQQPVPRAGQRGAGAGELSRQLQQQRRRIGHVHRVRPRPVRGGGMERRSRRPHRHARRPQLRRARHPDGAVRLCGPKGDVVPEPVGNAFRRERPICAERAALARGRRAGGDAAVTMRCCEAAG